MMPFLPYSNLTSLLLEASELTQLAYQKAKVIQSKLNPLPFIPPEQHSFSITPKLSILQILYCYFLDILFEQATDFRRESFSLHWKTIVCVTNFVELLNYTWIFMPLYLSEETQYEKLSPDILQNVVQQLNDLNKPSSDGHGNTNEFECHASSLSQKDTSISETPAPAWMSLSVSSALLYDTRSESQPLHASELLIDPLNVNIPSLKKMMRSMTSKIYKPAHHTDEVWKAQSTSLHTFHTTEVLPTATKEEMPQQPMVLLPTSESNTELSQASLKSSNSLNVTRGQGNKRRRGTMTRRGSVSKPFLEEDKLQGLPKARRGLSRRKSLRLVEQQTLPPRSRRRV